MWFLDFSSTYFPPRHFTFFPTSFFNFSPHPLSSFPHIILIFSSHHLKTPHRILVPHTWIGNLFFSCLSTMVILSLWNVEKNSDETIFKQKTLPTIVKKPYRFFKKNPTDWNNNFQKTLLFPKKNPTVPKKKPYRSRKKTLPFPKKNPTVPKKKPYR